MPIIDDMEDGMYGTVGDGAFRTLYLADECNHVQSIDDKDVREGRSPDCDECMVFSESSRPREWTWRKVYVKA